MKPSKLISTLLGLVVVVPIWYYLLYKILAAVNATEVMWLLYWVYVPVAMFCTVISKIAESGE